MKIIQEKEKVIINYLTSSKLFRDFSISSHESEMTSTVQQITKCLFPSQLRLMDQKPPQLNTKFFTEIKTLDRTCRICLEGQSSSLDNPLIIPCKCEGSIKYVHHSCIKKWIEVNKLKLNEAKCEICKTNFKIEIQTNYVLDKRKSKAFIIRTCLIYLVLMIIFGGFCCFVIVTLSSKNMIGNKGMKYIYISLGVLGILFFGIFSVNITKEYKKKCYYKQRSSFQVLNYQPLSQVSSNSLFRVSANKMGGKTLLKNNFIFHS